MTHDESRIPAPLGRGVVKTTCENCKFWRRDPQTVPIHGLDGSTAVVTLDAIPATGECRHELPQTRPDGRQWEPTRADDGCGQFKRRTKKGS